MSLISDDLVEQYMKDVSDKIILCFNPREGHEGYNLQIHNEFGKPKNMDATICTVLIYPDQEDYAFAIQPQQLIEIFDQIDVFQITNYEIKASGEINRVPHLTMMARYRGLIFLVSIYLAKIDLGEDQTPETPK